MSMENLDEAGFDRLRRMDVTDCEVVSAHHLARHMPRTRLAVKRAEELGVAAMEEAGLGDLLKDGRVFLAGGALLRALDGHKLEEDDCDLDVHPRTARDVGRIGAALGRAGYEFRPPVKGHVHTWVRDAFPTKVQVVTYAGSFPTRASCVARHDLHVCQWVLDGAALWCTEEAFTDWTDRELHVNQAVFPRDLVRRLSKYAARGYAVTPQALDALYGAMGEGDKR